jgi:ergothioneine biosynthesis protein EgtB
MNDVVTHINKKEFITYYLAERNLIKELCEPLAIEDYVIQSIEDVSPPKWHLAHTSWFFETFVLCPNDKNYQIFDPKFNYLFNSYYQGMGNVYPRKKRGLLSRPTVENIYAYREYIDKHIIRYIEKVSEKKFQQILPLLILGIHHEQQHQELLLTDIKYNLSLQPDFPIYKNNLIKPNSINNNKTVMIYKEMEGGVVDIGHRGNTFCFDNELPRHQQLLTPYSIAHKLVTNREYCEFIDAGGYQNPRWWLADGWDCVQKNRWNAPLYWYYLENTWFNFTLSGLKEIDPSEPVVHVSFYEADAYARWREKRLPTEIEWEHFVTTHIFENTGNFLESKLYHPQVAVNNAPEQFFGDVWEWTATPYCAYPGYKPPEGVLAEYNGKFMSNQFVLRGGSCVTPQSHIRSTYRNFFQPDKRWQFSGIRLADNHQREKR